MPTNDFGRKIWKGFTHPSRQAVGVLGGRCQPPRAHSFHSLQDYQKPRKHRKPFRSVLHFLDGCTFRHKRCWMRHSGGRCCSLYFQHLEFEKNVKKRGFFIYRKKNCMWDRGILCQGHCNESLYQVYWK